MRSILAVIFAINMATFAYAVEYTIPLSRIENVSGVSVKFNGSVSYSMPDNACEPIPLKLTVDMSDLNANLTAIVKSTGVEKNEKCGDKISISGASLRQEGQNLRARVEGNVGRQECVKTKVPVFHGLRMSMETKVVASTTIDSNANLEAVFDPTISNNALTASLVGRPDMDISNDILRGLADVFNLDDRLERKLAESIQRALAKPETMLQLPSELAGFQFTFADARIETLDGKLSLVVSGVSPRTQPLLPKFMEYLTGSIATAQFQCQ